MKDTVYLKNGTIEISMFGGFTIRSDGRTLSDTKGRTRQLWSLLEYLVANRLNDISQDKLIEILWEDEDSCTDPANALKNLVYRLRNLLRNLDTDEKRDYILYKRNNYCWNNELPCSIDTEEFEKAFLRGKNMELADDDRLAALRRAVDLYQGDFLPKSSMEDWVVARSAYYRNIFIEAVKGAYVLLVERECYKEAELICRRAVSIEPLDESLHELLIRLYLRQGDNEGALAYYEYASEMFYDKLGVRFSERVRATMREVAKKLNGIEKDLEVVSASLLKAESQEGAFFCDYEIFRNIYRLEARMAERFGQSVFVALLTLEPGSSVGQQEFLDIMQLLRTSVTQNLRKCDVVSRYSKSQFILMLPSLTLENGRMVMDRLVRKFNETHRKRNVSLSTKLHPVLSPK